MNICTITCQNAYNYGARLQTAALAHFLQKQGHRVRVIDYRPDYMRNNVPLFFWPGRSLRQWGKLFLQFPMRLRAKLRQPYFDNFSRTYIPLTKRIYWSIDELRANAPKADLYIAGSDQIWNTSLRNGTDPAYYLDFGDKSIRRISYAASFATEDILPSAQEFVQTHLAHFDAISVREHSALNILQSLGYSGTEVVDPVFLVSRSEWEKLADDTGLGEKYVLVYDFMNSPLIRQESERIARERHLKIYSIGDKRLRYCHRNYVYAGPETFLGLIRNASYVVSNSFHGTAFAMIFSIPYSVIPREDGLNTRLHELTASNPNHAAITRSQSFLQNESTDSRIIPNGQKPRIFINLHYMELGGAERALLGLLNAIDTTRVDVDLFLNQHTGPFMALIPPKIHLLPEEPTYSVIEKPLLECIRQRKWHIAWARIVAKHKYHRYLRKKHLSSDGSATHFVFDEVIRHLPSLYKYGHYDMAISFLDPPHIVQQRVDASLKLEWIHTDFSFVKVDIPSTEYWWRKNDHIVSISPDVTKQFLGLYPALKDKIIEIHNILSPVFVREQATAFSLPASADTLGLCTIGRISYQKNFESIPYIAKYLHDKGLHFHWQIIGPGDATPIILTARELGVNAFIEFVGPQDNPYPYINACDIYVQPSRYEGHSVTVREAQILYKPVVITNYNTAASQVQSGIDGIICPLDNQAVANAIFDLANDKALYQSIVEYMQSHDYGNEQEVNKLYQLLCI